MKTMMAILPAVPGGPEVLKLGEAPVPVPGEGEVLIEVKASGLNGADLAQRQGTYAPPKGAPEILGLEVAGVVAALGPGASGFEIGDRACALLTGGGYAQYCVAPAGQVAPLPAGLGFIEGAALMEALCTVWLNVFDLGGLSAGETFLVHGGASGIGNAAIQLAALHGARVWTTAGSETKTRLCLDLGAARAINYREQDFAKVIRESGEQIDVILDYIGGDYFEANVKCLDAGGRMIVIAFKGGRFGKIDLGRMLMRNISVQGSTMRSKPITRKAALVATVRREVWHAIEAGSYRVIVDSVFPAADAAKAHAYMETGSHMGKIVLAWDEALHAHGS
jgi:NADPH:quinone reductase